MHIQVVIRRMLLLVNWAIKFSNFVRHKLKYLEIVTTALVGGTQVIRGMCLKSGVSCRELDILDDTSKYIAVCSYTIKTFYGSFTQLSCPTVHFRYLHYLSFFYKKSWYCLQSRCGGILNCVKMFKLLQSLSSFLYFILKFCFIDSEISTQVYS